MSVREHISGTTRAICTNLFVHVAYGRGSVILRHSDEITRTRDSLGVFFPIVNALYSIAFGTHIKTAQPIQMPFGMITRVDHRYQVLDGGPGPPSGRAILRETVATYFKVLFSKGNRGNFRG